MDKAALLDAIAKSGSAGRAAYEQAQQALAGQQAEAVRMALASGVAGQAPAGAQAELERIVSQPYQSRTAQLAQNQASMEDWYNRLSASRGSWADQQQALQEVALQQALAEATGGSGGGGGGGGGGKSETWEQAFNRQFGSTSMAQKGLPLEAQSEGYITPNWRETGLGSPAAAKASGVRRYAIKQYGVPAATAEALFPESEFVSDFERAYGGYPGSLPTLGRRKALRELSTIIGAAPMGPGQSTGYTVGRATAAAQQQYGKKFVRKARRLARKGQK